MPRFLLLISCLFLMNTTSYAQSTPCADHHCLAVVDAGSTGSRLHIFTYDLDETNTPININELWAKKIKPGFATIDSDPSTIDAYITGLFAGAPAQQMPVYFYATAGMRLVSLVKQKSHYDNLRNWFNQHPDWQIVEAKTITGDDEAIYDWLAVNYKLGTLKSTTKHAVGVIDNGGASTQVAFPVQTNLNDEISKGKQVTLDLYGQRINVFVQSFLGLGQNEMTHQLLDSTPCFSNNYPLPDGEIGTGNAHECAENVASLINNVHKANRIVQPSLISNPVHAWYAIDGLSNLANSKPFKFTNNQLTPQELLHQGNELVCQQQWETLNSQLPNNEYADAYCLLPAYYYALLVDGYGFSPNQIVNIIPPDQSMDWTLGVVLHH
ncbi:MAG: multidrug DMT transporter permease [Legionella sp.]|uniref:multidrug DMT transporter permease n=1 Tax=Legionella sp. TaxID=459 RepID=UPI0039E3ABC5